MLENVNVSKNPVYVLLGCKKVMSNYLILLFVHFTLAFEIK